MQQMKEQEKNPPDVTNEEEIGSLHEKEFRVMIVNMIQNLGNRLEKIQEMFNKDLEELKSKQTMMNNTKNEIKNSLEGINSRITEAEEWISDLEDKIVEITTTEQNKEKRMKKGQYQRPLEQHEMHQHSNYRGPRRGREKERDRKSVV